MAKAPPWTPEQDSILREYNGVLSGEEVAKLVERTPKACGSRATRLGIRSLRIGRRAKDVAPELGVSVATVARLIVEGLLNVSRKPTYEDSQTPKWYVVEDEAIIEFLKTHYLRYDPLRLRRSWRKYVPKRERARWITIKEASREQDRSYQWFYELVWLGEIRAQKGRNIEGLGGTTYLYREDITSVKRRIHEARGQRPFAERADAQPRGGYKKGLPRGPGVAKVLTLEEQQEVCVHRWNIEPPNGPTSLGTCKWCGLQQEFRNSIQTTVWD